MSQLSLLIKPASSACNMRCAYCFYRDVADNRDRFSYGIMSAETTEAMLKNVFAYATGSVSFAFCDGNSSTNKTNPATTRFIKIKTTPKS